MSDSSRWWGVPLLTGAFVFLGVALAQGVTLWLHRRSDARTDAQRWDDERRVYADVVGLTRQVETALHRMDRGVGPDASYQDAADALRAAVDQVQLLGGEAVVDAAHRLEGAAALPLLRPPEDFPLDDVAEADQTRMLLEDRQEFLAAARVELGIHRPAKGTFVESNGPVGLVLGALRLALRDLLRAVLR